jgi:Ca-activated chloride channel family protein
MRQRNAFVPIAIAILAVSLAAARAEEAFESTTPGSLLVHDGDRIVEMPLEHTDVNVEVTAFLARTVIEQTFANPFDEAVEANYTFPLSNRGAVDDFRFIVGERVIRGEIHRREDARRIYESARRAGHRAALLEQERPNVFTQSIANIDPGEQVKVQIRVVETVPYEAGVYQFTFPLVVGPRYIPGGTAPDGIMNSRMVAPTSPVADAYRSTPPLLEPGFRSGHDVAIRIALDAGVSVHGVASPSHRIALDQSTLTTARVELDPADRIPNKDFILKWSVSSEKPALGLLAHRSAVDGFFTLLVQPKGIVSEFEAAPKEILLVLDTSGSMAGIPLEASKRFVRGALQTLGPRDTFNLIRFAGAAEIFSDGPSYNDQASIARALSWIEDLRGGGRTEMLSGLRAALSVPPDPDRLRLVIFLTDGYIGNEGQILAAISDTVGEARVFTLGIGTSVNHYLLDRMAGVGDGDYTFVRPNAHAEEAVDRFQSWVTKPYLTDLEIDWGALPVVDFEPQQPGDLFSGQTLSVVGRYVGGADGEVVVRGKLAGSYWEQRLHVELPEREEQHAALASIWARKRIQQLLLSSPGRVTAPVEAQVTALALEYRLMSSFTSFVAVDEAEIVNPEGDPLPMQQALPMPESVSFEGVFGPQGPPGLLIVADIEDAGADAPETGGADEASTDTSRGSPEVAEADLPEDGGPDEKSAGTSGGSLIVVVAEVPEPAKPDDQSTDTSRRPLSLRVVGRDGPLAGALVIIENPDLGIRTGAIVTGGRGSARFRGLPSGPGYRVRVAIPGYSTQLTDSIAVRPGRNKGLTVQLKKKLQRSVPVYTEQSVIEVNDWAPAPSEPLAMATAPGRFYQNVLNLAPGVQDADGDGNPNVHGGRDRDFKAVVGGVSNVDPLTGQLIVDVNPNSIEEMEVITARSSVEFSRSQAGFARVRESRAASGAVGSAPVRKPAPPRVRIRGAPAPGAVAPEQGQLIDASLRVLADLAEDGRLSAAEGIPSLAAILAGQMTGGAISRELRVHAVATWALAEAAAALPEDPWVREAAALSQRYLFENATPAGWPSMSEGEMDAESTRWCLLVAGWIGPDRVPEVALPPSDPDGAYERLQEALEAVRTGTAIEPPSGRRPFDRLVRAIPAGRLRVAG